MTATLGDIYRPSLALLTDLYQLTMAYGYWKSGVADREAVFHLFFRKRPFDGGYAIACGLAWVLDLCERFRFDEQDVAYLATLAGADGEPLFERAFLDELRGLRLRVDLDAMPEGTAVFAHEPLLRVRGPIIDCQLLETALLNVVNFQTLIATKAARVCRAAGDAPVLELGLRRAQGVDGSLAASRAAYVGGCAATSNVLAGRLFGIPVRGTHAHSWVMLFDDELDAFRRYAEAMPGNCVFLVDTYDTLRGVRHAIEAGHELRARGHEMIGIRLDSGDLAYLAIEARRMLDEAGFPDASIVASNELDEHVIESLKQQGAPIGVWGVGTRLVTGDGQPALGGVYKLGAVRAPGQAWQHRVKVSDQAVKTSIPGILQVRRFEDPVLGTYAADAIYDEDAPPAASTDTILVDPFDATRRRRFAASSPCRDLLVPAIRGGRVVYESPPLEEVRRHARSELSRLHAGIRRLMNAHEYPVGLELSLHERRTELVLRAREGT